MAYIGKTPTIGNFQVCDAISVVNGQAAYTMQVGSVNVSPESANHMLVSLNGILQRSGSSFTVSGSTITFASNLVTGDVIDFIQILGNVLDLGVPSDSTVSTAKIVDGAVTSAKLASGAGVGKFESQLLHVRDEKSSGTAAGNATGGAQMVRVLNTVKTNEITGASLSSNQITLPSGTYYIKARAPSFMTNNNKIYLYNVTDSSNTLIGSSSYCDTTYQVAGDATLFGRFTISAQKVFELKHDFNASRSGNGLGVETSLSGVIEVYAEVQIWKVA